MQLLVMIGCELWIYVTYVFICEKDVYRTWEDETGPRDCGKWMWLWI